MATNICQAFQKWPIKPFKYVIKWIKWMTKGFIEKVTKGQNN